MSLFQIDLRYMSVTGDGYGIKCLYTHLHIADVSIKTVYIFFLINLKCFGWLVG